MPHPQLQAPGGQALRPLAEAGWAGKLRPPEEEGALLSMETPHRPEPRQEGASPGPGTEATATAIPRGPHPQQVAACQSSLPPPGLPQGPEPEPQGRVAVWGAGVSGSPHLSAMSCPCLSPRPGLRLSPCRFLSVAATWGGDKDNPKWPTLAHRLLSEANSPKPAGLRKTSRPLRGTGRDQDGARLLPGPLGKQAVGLAALARPPDTPPRSRTLGSY